MRLIDADALAQALHEAGTVMGQPHFLCRTVYECINNAPIVDAVTVVRCKDCVHGTDRTEEFGEGCVNPIACMMYSSDGEPDFFPKDNYCGFGERRDDEAY